MNEIKRCFLAGEIGLNTALHQVADELGIDTEEAMIIVKEWDGVHLVGDMSSGNTAVFRDASVGSAIAGGIVITQGDIVGGNKS